MVKKKRADNCVKNDYYARGLIDFGGWRESFEGYIESIGSPRVAATDIFSEGNDLYNLNEYLKKGAWITYIKIYTSHKDYFNGKMPLYHKKRFSPLMSLVQK